VTQSGKSSLRLTLQQTPTLHQVDALTADSVLLPTHLCLIPFEASEGIQQSERSSGISDGTSTLTRWQLNCTSAVLVLSTINVKDERV